MNASKPNVITVLNIKSLPPPSSAQLIEVVFFSFLPEHISDFLYTLMLFPSLVPLRLGYIHERCRRS